LSPKKDLESDIDLLLAPLAAKYSAFYAFYRLDSTNSLGHEFILYSYINDQTASVRDKMLYASTLSTIKTAFGGGHISRELVVSAPEELTLAGFKEQKRMDEIDGPLTENELIKREIKQLETASVITKHETVPGLSFPLTSGAAGALRNFSSGEFDYVQLCIDTDKEEISVSLSERLNGSAHALQSKISTASPNYHLFNFSYKHNGKSLKKQCFIYSIPTGAEIPIKEKMLYASCKASFVAALSNFGLKSDEFLSIEIDGPSEVSEEALISQLHPDLSPTKKAQSKQDSSCCTLQ